MFVRARCSSLLVVLLSAALSAQAASAAADEADSYTHELAGLINAYRVEKSLPRVELSAPLSALAHEHAKHMAQDNRLSHDGFQKRFAKAQAAHCVENVGQGYGTPRGELEAWRNSSVHDRNLLDPRITRMGLAVERGYVAFFACS